MKKTLLLFFLFFCAVTVSAQNDFYAWAATFDDMEVGSEFQVVDVNGNVVEGAQAVVETDAENAQNKVLHVTTGATPGYVLFSNPGNATAASMLKKYDVVSLSIKSKNAYDSSAACCFELYFGKYYAYKDKESQSSVFEANTWKQCYYTPLELEKNTTSREFKLGLKMANADYYIDDICFMSDLNAFEREKEAREKAIRDSIWQAQEEEYAAKAADVERNIDKLWAYDFENYPVGTEFSVFPKKGDTPVEGAKAVVEIDSKNSKNKVLHITTPQEIGYVELDNPHNPNSATAIMGAASLLKLSQDVSISIMRSTEDNVTANSNFEIVWGGYYAHNAAPKSALTAGKWVTNTFHLALEQNSRSQKMRLGLCAVGADFYIDDIVFIMTSYDMTKAETTVRYWADKMGKNFGTCVNPGIGTGDTFGKTVANNFNMVVLENAMKFDATEPRRNSFNWQADGVVSFAEQNGMKVRGHTLTWHGQNPDWVSDVLGSLSGAAKREEAIKILKNHIYNVVGHWKGRIAEWDVVNECLEENQGRAVGAGYATRTYSVWYSGFGGEDYIDSAFVWAHQADPNAKLYINDYNIGHWGGGHYENGKTHAMYNLAKRLKDAGIPIDGVGMQMHTSVSGLQPAQIDETIRQFREIGLNCIITEMDMPGSKPITDAELVTQAQKYAQIADIMIKYDNAPTFMVWGVRDNQSWLDDSEQTKPLLFFADLSPHQAYIDVRKTYQKRSLVLSEVEPISVDDDSPVWFKAEPKNLDVYDLTGRKIAVIQSFDELEEFPQGLYIVGGKKIMVRP